MRHGDKINNLGRTTAHRKALLSNLACQLIQYKRITTTLAKAKSLRMYVEPMVTKSKSDTVNNRRLVFAKLQDKEAIKELFGAVSDKVANRPGGYTRIIKLAPRIGDAAEMAMIELVDFNTIYTKDAKAGTAKKTRRSRGGATKTAAPKAETTVATEEAPATEAPEQAKEEGAE
jgi:large subunit ribosomal protein L17